MEAYQYSELGSRDFRLLQLHTASASDQSILSCSIHHVSLDDHEISYKALSYAWGTPRFERKILINGKSKDITFGLEAVLRRLRSNSILCVNDMCSCRMNRRCHRMRYDGFAQPVFLWIDALCINQWDKEEKSHQVSYMSHIYSRAQEVVIWLGEELKDTRPALRLIHGLADLYEFPAAKAPGFISYVVREETFQDDWIALGNFFSRPWWTRAWIVQEVVMARKGIVLCGQWGADWDDICKAASFFKVCSTYMDEITEAMCLTEPCHRFSGFRTKLGRLEVLKLLRFFIFAARGDPILRSRIKSEILVSSLQMLKNHTASNPRDKIYAARGIQEELGLDSLIKVDYDLSVCELYMQVAKQLCQSSKTLDFLGMVERDRLLHQKEDFGLPSWTPDWRIRTNVDPLWGAGRNLPSWSKTGHIRDRSLSFSFTRDSAPHCEFNFDMKTATISGFIVDGIEKIKPRFKDLVPDFKAEGTIRYGHRITWRPVPPAIEFEHNDFWITRLRHRAPRNDILEQEIEEMAHIQPTPEMDEPDTPVLKLTCFETAKYHFVGLADSHLQVGDSVCALLGANVPYILRKRDEVWCLVGQW
jgi:hypothetical protein